MKPWTPEEDAVVRRGYAEGGRATAAQLLPGRSPWSISVRARQLGVLKRTAVVWTEAELAVLRARFVEEGPDALLSALPGRSREAIGNRAHKLGLYWGRWTPDDDRKLQSDWGFISMEHIARGLGRTKRAIYDRAHKLGLERGIPEEMESLTAAAARTGYALPEFRWILAYAGVRPQEPMSIREHRNVRRARQSEKRRARGEGGTRARKLFHRQCVDPLEVDEAVAKWMTTEKVGSAARVRGICAATLRDILRRAGYPMPSRYGTWRLPSADIDKAIESHRHRGDGKLSIRDAAARLQVHPHRLSVWLREAGIDTTRRPCFVELKEVERIVRLRVARKESRVSPETRERFLGAEAAE